MEQTVKCISTYTLVYLTITLRNKVAQSSKINIFVILTTICCILFMFHVAQDAMQHAF